MDNRTPKQNASLHVYCELLAEAMNCCDLDMRTAIRVPIHPTKENVKENIIKPVMKAMFPDVESTAQLSKVQLSDLYEQVNIFTAQRWGISVEFPKKNPPGLAP